MSRRRRTCLCRLDLSASEQVAKVLRRTPAAADLEQSADESAYHAAQEAGTEEPHPQLTAVLIDRLSEQPPERLTVTASLKGESGEIVDAGQVLRRPAHGKNVERAFDAKDERRVERTLDATTVDAIEVLLAQGVLASVEAFAHPVSRQHAYISRKPVVGAMNQPFQRERPGELEMGHLAASVDAGVGSTGTEDPLRRADQIAERFFDGLLDAGSVFLTLPAGISGAVVGDRQSIDHFERHHNQKNGSQIARKSHGK